ncbi:MAG: steroid 5-alpha reductase, partial [Okeania sp. SIO2B9]|nr:steroid 5-alpha reductase [Okeania sp. SIO2B9]
MKVKHPINLSKATTFIFILTLMIAYQNFSLVAWVYLSLHGTYGI